MDEKSLPDLLANILPDEVEKTFNLDGENTGTQDDMVAALLKASAGSLVSRLGRQPMNSWREKVSSMRSPVQPWFAVKALPRAISPNS